MKKTLQLIAVLSLLLCLALAACDMGTPGANPVESGTQAGTQAGNQTDRPSNGRPDGPSEDGTWDTSSQEGNKPPEAFDTEPETEPVTAPPSITGPDHEFTPGGPSVTGPGQETEPPVEQPTDAETDPAPHEHSFGNWTTVREATCTQKGEQRRVCACGEYQSQSISMIDHVLGEVVVEVEYEPDCSSRGKSYNVTYCATCGMELGRESFWVDAKGHTAVIDPAIEATCITDGKTEGSHCSVCKQTLTYQETIYATGVHVYVDEVCKYCSAKIVYSEGLQFSSNGDGTCYVSGIGSCTDADIVIPKVSPDGDVVTKIGSYAFDACYDVDSVIIPNTVTEIDVRAFYDCHGLSKVNIPDGVTSIGYEAFSDCSIKTIDIPDSVTTIEDAAFEGCNDLLSVTLPDGITCIGNRVFNFCSSLKSIVIPDDVTSIGDEAFGYCRSLQNIIIPNSVTSIGNHAFAGCEDSTDITIGTGVNSIGIGAFAGCDITVSKDNTKYHDAGNCLIDTESKTLIAGCKTSVIPDDGSVTSIGEYAFAECISLKDIVIPEGVKSIGAHAFEGCTGFTSITIPDSVVTIGEFAFSDCTNVKTVTLGNGVARIESNAFDFGYYNKFEGVYIKDLAAWCAIEFADYNGLLEEAGNLYLNGELITDLVIPEGVTHISDYAFYECTCLTSVTFASSVTSIGEEAFTGCEGLTSITIPGNVKSIGNSAFSGCSGLVTVTMEEGVESIGNIAFIYCSALTNVSIPNSMKSISDAYFVRYCDALQYNEYKGIKYLGNKQNPYVVLIAPDDKTQSTYEIHPNTKFIYRDAFKDCKRLTSMVLPEGLISIGSYAFYNCTYLESINLPATLKYIGEYAFYSCQNLKMDLAIPDGVTSIPGYAFYRVPLTNITIPDSVTHIGAYAFSENYSLQSLSLGSGVTSIGSKAFYRSYPSSVHITDLAAWCEIAFYDEYSNPACYELYCNGELVTDVIVPEGVTHIGNYAFYKNQNLTNVNIPNSVTAIGNYAFYGCSYLNEINVPDDVTAIGNYAFHGCSSLSEINIPDGVTSIGNYAFHGCTSLNEINIPDGVTAIGDYAFYNCYSLSEIILPNSVTVIGKYAFCSASLSNGVTLSEGLISIGEYAFSGTSMASIIIPDSVIEIGNYAFSGQYSGCYNLTNVVIGNSVERIGDYAFSKCYNLESVSMPDSVTHIGKGAFRDCESLISVNIPESVTYIGDYAFAYCEKLASAIVIPDGMTEIRANAFDGCSNVPYVIIGNNITKIGNSAFANCDSITSVIIPGCVESIGDYAFQQCDELQYVILEQRSLKEIGVQAFACQSFIDGSINFDRIYYTGTEEDWAKIELVTSSYYPMNVSPYYYSETAPTGKGNYWHYNDKGEIRVWNVEDISYRAEQYAEQFANAAFGDAESSYSSQYLTELKEDMLFQASVVIWEGLHIATDTSWDSKMISKKDTYKLVIYDLLVGKVGSDVNPIDFINGACDTYVYKFSKFILTDEIYDSVEDLKKLDPTKYDYETFSEYFFGSVEGVSQVFETAGNLYDALYVCAQYQALSDMDAYYRDILMEIASDYSLPKDLRNAARECADCYSNATEEMLQRVLVGELVNGVAEDVWNRVEEELWKTIVNAVFPGAADVIQLGLKGVMLLVDGLGFNMDAINEAYYQLEAAVGLENALRRVIQNEKPDYFRYEMLGESEYYMYAIDKYKTSVLLGYDYSNALLKELHKGASASEKDDYEAQMRELSGLKQEKEKLYNNFDATVSAAYETYCK